MDTPITTLPEKPVDRCNRCGVVVEKGRLLCDVCRYIRVNLPVYIPMSIPYPFYPYQVYPYYQPVYNPLYYTWQTTSGGITGTYSGGGKAQDIVGNSTRL